MGFVPFIDITGESANRAPLVKGGLRAYYASGSGGIEETTVQILAAKAAGMGIALIDQTPGLSLFARGIAHIADVENGAGTIANAAAAVAKRQALGIKWHTIYVGYDNWPAMQAAIEDASGVLYGVANYSWSLAEAETLLGQHPAWAYVQYGDPASNPATLVPGTSVTLEEANADIDVAQASWAALFLPDPPPPEPAQPVPSGLGDTPYAAVDLGWTPVATATAGYDVQVVNAAGTKQVYRKTVGTPYCNGVVLPPGSYKWRVACLAVPGKEQTGAWSAYKSFSTVPGPTVTRLREKENSMINLFRKADAYLAAHPQLVTVAVTAGATWIAKYGFNVSATVVAAVASLAVAIVGALANSSVKRAARRS